MEKISNQINKMSSQITDSKVSLDYDSFQKKMIDDYNKSAGTLEGYDCYGCKNRGYFKILKNGHEFMKECECMGKRRHHIRLKKAGLLRLVEKYTFDSFKVDKDWQKLMIDTANKAIKDHEAWLYIGGHVGSGKTHICIAAVNELVKQGLSARYLLWRDDGRRLKANVNDPSYDDMIGKFKEVDLLYIDDLFKTEQSKLPTSADINVAYEIVNYRYNNMLKTIISCERTIDEIISIDEGLGSRIYEMSRNCCVELLKDGTKNYRMRK